MFAKRFSNVNGSADNPVAAKLSAARKYVVTSTLDDLSWTNSVAIIGDVGKEITRLKNLNGPLLQVHGSWQLVKSDSTNSGATMAIFRRRDD